MRMDVLAVLVPDLLADRRLEIDVLLIADINATPHLPRPGASAQLVHRASAALTVVLEVRPGGDVDTVVGGETPGSTTRAHASRRRASRPRRARQPPALWPDLPAH